MFSRVFLLLVASAYVVCQILALDSFIAELTIESNVTLKGQTVLSILNTTTPLDVSDSGGSHAVTLISNEIIAECLLVGDDTTCNCSEGYIWSNDVCYNFSCCRDTPCSQNVSYMTPLCVAKVPVHINGSVETTSVNIGQTLTMLNTEFEKLNGLDSIDITTSTNKVEFKAELSSELKTSVLEDIVTRMTTSFPGLLVDVEGLVTMKAPDNVVCYESEPTMTCMFAEASDSAFWRLSKPNEMFMLNNGSVVELSDCATQEHPSCVAVVLKEVTGIWAGMYTCSFSKGSVHYTAKTTLKVALLPDEIAMTFNPLVVDCKISPIVEVTATVPLPVANTMSNYDVQWSYRKETEPIPQNTTAEKSLLYIFTFPIDCEKTKDPHLVKITFKNPKDQIKSAEVEIPVIYADESVCEEEVLNGDLWPKTPFKATVINKTCPEGRSGYKSRTCDGPEWQEVFNYCVNEMLSNALNAADNFVKGQGATQEVAMDIFEGIKNSSGSASDSGEDTADVDASINILTKMSEASGQIVLQSHLFPTFVESASNMLKSNWSGVNDTVLYKMSSNYLQAVETLVENINTTEENEQTTENIDVKICPRSDCNVTLFNTQVSLNKSFGVPKIAAIKNLMPKLENTFRNTEKTGMLISGTVQQNHLNVDRGTSDVKMIINFLTEESKDRKPYCVFWNITTRKWSDNGCKVVKQKNQTGNRVMCECNHLTSFSVLMAKRDISDPALDIITNVGLGVSVCSLVILLVIESLVWSAVVKSNLSHFRHTAIVNIATFRLLADCTFLASSSPQDLSDALCFTFTLCKHLFYLAKFCWMLCLSIMLVHQLIFVFSPLRKRVFMFLSGIVGYIFPILIVGSSYVYCKYTFRDYYNKKTCWLVFDRILEGSIHAFLIPVGSVMLTNLFSIVVVIITLTKASGANSAKASDKETAKSIIKVLVLLAPVFGITWVIGFFLLILDEDNPGFPVANYAFTILNSFQGLFILFAGCFAEQKVREEFLKVITGKSKGNSDSSKNLTSTTNTKDK